MEITNLVTADNEQNGKWFQVELYGKKQNFALKILGEHSDKVVKFSREKLKKMPINKTFTELEEEEMDSLLELADEGTIIKLVGISSIKTKLGVKGFELTDEPVTLQGKVLKDDEESYRYLIEKIPAIIDFINSVSKKRSNFLD